MTADAPRRHAFLEGWAARLGGRLAESAPLPDKLLRAGIRRMLRQRLRELAGGEASPSAQVRLRALMREAPIAILADDANRQHYEVDAAFFERVLGPALKYSCAYWPPGVQSLPAAEEAMLALTAERAGIRDSMRILDLGCGWGSLSLWLASRHPGSHVVAVSHSKSQREFILARAAQRRIRNLEVVTADANRFEPDQRFDRVVSVEMFEHMRNWEALLARIARWLEPDGKLFVHVFCHREAAYFYEDRGPGDWMARTFFSGGLMPSETLLESCGADFALEQRWRVGGLHYQRTCDAWLANLDGQREALRPVLERTYGPGQASIWMRRWRLFFLACSELFGFREGREWFVSHALLSPQRRTPA